MPEIQFYNREDATAPGGVRNIAYVTWGDPKNPAVTCVHGLTRQARDFDILGAYLADLGFYVIAPDVAGRGRSDWLVDKMAYHNLTYADDIAALLTALGVEQTHWVGTSMGGLICMVMAAKYRKMLNRVVINDIGPFLPGSALARIGDYCGKDPVFTSETEAFSYLNKTLAPWGVTNPDHQRQLFVHSFHQTAAGWRQRYDPAIGSVFLKKEGDAPLPDVDLWELWKMFTCPVLVLRGETSDLFLHDTAVKMVEGRTDAKLVEFPTIGHAPSLMEPEHLKLIGDWLKVI